MSKQGEELSRFQSSPDEYSPPPYLLAGTGLSRAELVVQYDVFIHSLRHVAIAPELVFERLVGNLNEGFSQALTQESSKYETAREAWNREKAALQAGHAAAQEGWRREKTTLQADLARAIAPEKEAKPLSLPSRTGVAAAIPPVQPGGNQIYLQFWFSSTTVDPSRRDAPFTCAHLATTTTPIPYGLAGSWSGMEHVRASTNYGSYDTRMDTRFTAPTLPTIVTHIVRFQKAFDIPPLVMVWLTGLSAANGAEVFLQVTPTNVTETEFALQITSGAAARLGSVGVAWAVWHDPTGWASGGVAVGSVTTVAPVRVRSVHLDGHGEVAGRTPLLVAFSAIDLVLYGNLWMDVGIAKQERRYGPKNLSWKMRAGPVDSKVYSAILAFATS